MTWFIYAVLGAFLTSLSAIVEKKALTRLHAMDFSIVVALVAAILSSPILLSVSWEQVTPAAFGLIAVIAVVAMFAFLDVTRGIRHLEISTSSALFLFGPFISASLAYLILGETLTGIQLGGMLLLALGLYVLETRHFWHGGEFVRNIWGDKYSRYILLGLFLYGFTIIGDRIVLSYYHVPAPLYTAIVQVLIAVCFICYALIARGSIRAPLALARDNWKIILLAALLMTSYRIMQAEAVAIASAVGLVIAIKRSSALFTTIVGGELFSEHDLLRKSVACLVMIAGVYCIVL